MQGIRDTPSTAMLSWHSGAALTADGTLLAFPHFLTTGSPDASLVKEHRGNTLNVHKRRFFMNIGNRYRQSYCDLYPSTRRRHRKLWSAVVSVSIFVIACGLDLLVHPILDI